MINKLMINKLMIKMINFNQAGAPRWVIWGATALITLGCGLRLANLGQFVPWYLSLGICPLV
jgi:hypothetical protein